MDGSSLTENLEKEIELMERTLEIFAIVRENQPIGISKIANKMDIPEHKVRYSLRMLQKERLIEPSGKGAILTEKHEKFEKDIIELLDSIDETVQKLEKKLER
ncbi:MAG: winged-helix domain-containing protein [Thermoplasmata archaeon]